MSRASSRSRQPSPFALRRLRTEDHLDQAILGADHTAFHAGRTAVITGGASGIGLAAAKKFARHGLKVVIADRTPDALKAAQAEIIACTTAEGGAESVLTVATDVSKLEDVERLKEEAVSHFGEVNVLFNNAGIGKGKDGSIGTAFENLGAWKDILDTNLGGVINVTQVFTPIMIHQENPSLIIITGSKQGITNPPGNIAYNSSKAAVRFLAEGLAHDLRSRGAKTTVHLLVPGWTHTGMTGTGTKPEGAWTAEQTVGYMFDKVRLGDFYIVCPDNETSSELDHLRMRWSAEDIVEGRPALSRWHPEYKPLFEEYIREGLKEFRTNGVDHQ